MSNNSTLILGIETSCDETSAAIVADGKEVLSSEVASQVNLHAKFHGVVPEIASRAHLECINVIIDDVLNKAGLKVMDMTAISVVNRPGLIGSLLIGLTTAKTFSWILNCPLITVNHIHSHIYGASMSSGNEPESVFPAIGLVVSGGHTSIYFCNSPLDMKLLGATQDDAAGEAFDKVATILDLPYPGGPAIDKLARTGSPNAVDFPRTWLDKDSFNFSFSGIKTAVLYYVRGTDLSRPDSSHLSEQEKADISASFQSAVVEVLVEKSIRACKKYEVGRLLVGGGVAANSYLRSELIRRCEEENIKLILADVSLCTDNAAMVGGLGYHKYRARLFARLDEEAYSTVR